MPKKSSHNAMNLHPTKPYTTEMTAREIAVVSGLSEGTVFWLVKFRLGARERRLFACDCADRVLWRARLGDREPNAKSWTAIDVTRKFAFGYGSISKLEIANNQALEVARQVCEREGTRPWPRI
jgi:hypothetical protein